jgi:hypothetical protein
LPRARTATSEYSSALRQHVDELEGVGRAGVVITELAALTRAMMERTIAIETELACSERRAAALQTSLEETRRLAEIDHLTGLPNRRAFDHMLEREMRESRSIIERETKHPCRVVASPYGDHDRTVMLAAHRAGYDGAVRADDDQATGPVSAYRMPRVRVGYGDGIEVFAAAMERARAHLPRLALSRGPRGYPRRLNASARFQHYLLFPA